MSLNEKQAKRDEATSARPKLDRGYTITCIQGKLRRLRLKMFTNKYDSLTNANALVN